MSTAATTTTTGNTKKAAIFAGVGAVATFGACKLFKAKKKTMIIAIVAVTLVAAVVGYKN